MKGKPLHHKRHDLTTTFSIKLARPGFYLIEWNNQ